MSEWIKVSDQMPKLGVRVLSWDDDEGARTGYRVGGGRKGRSWQYFNSEPDNSDLGDTFVATHWMPLPAPPSADQESKKP